MRQNSALWALPVHGRAMPPPAPDERLLATPAGAVSAMAVGFVLISAAPGREHEVYNTLLKVSEIVELHPLFGEYDLIAKLEAADFDTLGHVIVNKIRSIEGVVDTKTLTGTKF
jgi:DNA-binding Lrp family transcriptional regulator